jgi:Fe-S cluster biosynthesis and repair protein YggX
MGDSELNTVMCRKLGRMGTALARAPVPGVLGQKLLADVSEEAWREWLKHQTMLINENRLNPLKAEARAFLLNELERYFYGDGSAKPAGFTPLNDS